jgi:Intracellular proteinase inhibitor
MDGPFPASMWVAFNVVTFCLQGKRSAVTLSQIVSAESRLAVLGPRCVRASPVTSAGPIGPVHRGKMTCLCWLGGLLLLVGLAEGWPRPLTYLDSGVEVRSDMSDLSLLLRANKAVYAEGEPLELTLEVVNRSPRPVTLQFRDSQRYDFLIRNAQGQEVWRWSAGQMFAQMLGEETLAPDGENLTYRTVKQLPLMRGSYTVIGVVPAMGAQMSARLQVTIQ